MSAFRTTVVIWRIRPSLFRTTISFTHAIKKVIMVLALYLLGISSILFTIYPIHLFQGLEAFSRALTVECTWGKIYLRKV